MRWRSTTTLKVVVLVERAAGMAPDACHGYWRETPPEVLRGVPESVLPLRKYVQYHTVRSAYEPGEPPADGVAELWLDDRTAVREWFEHPCYESAVAADEQRFINRADAAVVLVQATTLDFAPVDPEMITLFVPTVRASDLTLREFHRPWRYDHPAVVLSTDAWALVKHYVQNHPLNEVRPDEAVPFDGIAEAWFGDEASLAEWMDHPDQANTIRPALKRFSPSTS